MTEEEYRALVRIAELEKELEKARELIRILIGDLAS